VANDRPDLAGGEIHGEGRRAFYLGRGKAVRRIDLAVQAILAGPIVDCVQQAVHLEVGHWAIIMQRTSELRLAVEDASDPAN
jgi:hypothetical protein